MITSTITKRGQTTIPRKVRDALKLESGQRLVYEIEEDKVVLRSDPGLLASFGVLKRADHPARSVDFRQSRAAAREEWTEQAEQEGTKVENEDC